MKMGKTSKTKAFRAEDGNESIQSDEGSDHDINGNGNLDNNDAGNNMNNSNTDNGVPPEDTGDLDMSSSSNKKSKSKKKASVFGDKFLAQTENFNVKLRKRGVVYVARVPPRMTPTKVKSLLSEFGEVTRVYLVQEDKTVRQRRKKQGGSGSKRFTEGWVEFAKKDIAKHVAASLNNTPITNYKRSSHYGDLWNLKYLSKFRWSHLTEKVAYERRVQEQKLRVEMMQARRENASYVELVEKGKKLDSIEARKRRRGEEMTSTKGDEVAKESRKKRQNRPMDDTSDSATKKALLRSLV